MIVSIGAPKGIDIALSTRNLPLFWVVSSDTWSEGDVELVRQEETLAVNGLPLAPGQSLSQRSDLGTWSGPRIPTFLSLWIVTWRKIEVTNYGGFSCFVDKAGQEHATDGLYVHMSERQGWAPNPLGAIVLGVGIWLLVRARRARKQE
jgi:hypothetical protein